MCSAWVALQLMFWSVWHTIKWLKSLSSVALKHAERVCIFVYTTLPFIFPTHSSRVSINDCKTSSAPSPAILQAFRRFLVPSRRFPTIANNDIATWPYNQNGRRGCSDKYLWFTLKSVWEITEPSLDNKSWLDCEMWRRVLNWLF